MTKAPDRIEIPAAWYGEALAQTPEAWTWRLSDLDIAELVGAAKTFIGSGDALSGITSLFSAAPIRASSDWRTR